MSALEEALNLAYNGFRVFPLRHKDKRPAIKAWPEVASAEDDDIKAWFDGEAGVGVRCGQTAFDGTRFFVVDIDVKDGQPGLESWDDVVAECPDLKPITSETVCVETPSGGFHYYFVVPDGRECPTNGRPWEGIDIRGEGGYVVAPPSELPNGQYRWVRDPQEFVVLPAPESLMDALDAAARQPTLKVIQGGLALSQIEQSISAHPTSQSGDSPADWLRSHVDVGQMLREGGWTQMQEDGGKAWKRPGKSEQGRSATLHDDGLLVVFSQNAPQSFISLGKTNRDGSLSLSPAQVYAAVHFNGNFPEAMSYVRKQLMPQDAAPPSVANKAEKAGDSAGVRWGTPAATANLNLPEEFWEASDVLGHIRDAALSRLVSPDAVLVSVLSRIAALTAPSVRIPAFVGSKATFDFMSVVVAASSGGKSVSNDVSADLLPPRNKRVLMDAPIGSGEGLIQAFMGLDEDGKNPSYKHGDIHSIHFTIDEGLALMKQTARQGTTVLPTLLSAWSGKTLGQLNASIETKRLVPGGKRRVAATINMQTANGHMLWEHASTGLVSRCLFGWAHSPVPDILPEWPGELQLQLNTGWGSIIEQEIEYPPEVAQSVREARIAVMTGSRVLGDDEGHNTLVRIKCAGLMAFLHNRFHVKQSDWELAGLLVSSSDAVKQHLQSVKKEYDRDARHTKAAAAGYAQIVQEEVVQTEKQRRCEQAVIRKLARSQAPLRVAQIRNSLSKDLKPVLPNTIEALLDQERIVEVEEGLRLA